MKTKELEYITWFKSPHWSSNIILGDKGVYYRFEANWNNRNNCWSINISLDRHVLIHGVDLVLNVDPLALCYSKYRPDCILFPTSENMNIKRISYNHMTSGEVKLYHILTSINKK